MRYTLRVVDPPEYEPVSVSEARQELRVPDSIGDVRLHSLIVAARVLAEAYTNRAFIDQRLVITFDRFPTERLEWWDGVRQGSVRGLGHTTPITLPMPPLIEVEEVAYFDDAGVEHTLGSDVYYVDDLSEPGRIILNTGRSWPTGVRDRAAVRVTYRAGYGPKAAAVPFIVREAILAHARDAIDRPNAAIASETIDNASVTYANRYIGSRGGNVESAPDSTGGLRGGASNLLTSLRVHSVGV